MGRPRKPGPENLGRHLDAEMATRILSDVSRGVTPTCAARRQGVSRSLWGLWRGQALGQHKNRPVEPYRTFFLSLQETEAEYQAALEMSLFTGAARDPKLAREILRTRYPEEWGEAGKELPPLPPESADPLERMEIRLVDLRRLRQRAERDGSYVAATQLILQETDLVGKIEAFRGVKQEEARLKAARESGSMEEAATRIREMVLGMPETLLATLRDAISARVARSESAGRQVLHEPEPE